MNSPDCFNNIRAAILYSVRTDADCHGQHAAAFSDISYRYYILHMCRKYILDPRRENLRREHGYLVGTVRAAALYRERPVVKSA
jgi:hypothetical protein